MFKDWGKFNIFMYGFMIGGIFGIIITYVIALT